MPTPVPTQLIGTFDFTSPMTEVIEATVKMTVEETLIQYLEMHPANQVTPEFLTRQEAADMLKISVASLDQLRRNKLILTANIGPTIRIPSTEITKYLTQLK